MKTTQKGFIVLLLLIIVAILLAGGGAYFYTQNKSENPPVTENVTLPQATSTAQTSKATSVPTITSIATSTDHDLVNIVISGSNFTNWATVEYLNNGKLADSFCGYLGNNGTLTHSWGQPEGGWSFYSNVNQLRVVNADCRTADIKSGLTDYPSVTVSISMVNNFPTFKSTQTTPTIQTQTSNSQTAGWKTYTNSQYGFEILYPSSWSEESTRDLTVVRLVSQQTQGTDTNANLFQSYIEVSGVYKVTCKNSDWVSTVNSVTTQFVKTVCRPDLKLTIIMKATKATSEDAQKLEDTILSTLKLTP